MASELCRFRLPGGGLAFRQLGLALFAIAVLIPAGCNKPEDVTAYDVPKIDNQETLGKNRLLAAVFLNNETAWHFKLVGPMQEMGEHEREFLKFLNSVRFDKDGKPTWSIPDGWEREPDRRSRFAAFLIGKGLAALELTVVPLPAVEGDINLLNNVNRWRRLMHRQPLDQASLAQILATCSSTARMYRSSI